MLSCKHDGHNNTPMFNLNKFSKANNILHISVNKLRYMFKKDHIKPSKSSGFVQQTLLRVKWNKSKFIIFISS